MKWSKEIEALGLNVTSIMGGKVWFKNDETNQIFCLCYPCNFFALMKDGRSVQEFRLRLNDLTIEKVKALIESAAKKQKL